MGFDRARLHVCYAHLLAEGRGGLPPSGVAELASDHAISQLFRQQGDRITCIMGNGEPQ